MELQFHTLNVFTRERFGGNPLAVVLGADALDTPTMQKIAAEFNLSETVFVTKPDNGAHSAKLRIFTPKAELEFAGHPTVGTAVLLAELRASQVGTGGSALITLEENVGLVRVGVRVAAPGAVSFGEFDGPVIPFEAGTAPSRDDIASALGLIPSEIGYANHRPVIFDGGSRFLFVPVASAEVLAGSAVNLGLWRGALREAGGVGAYLYCNQPGHAAAHFRARLFAPAHGIMEDPATGSAAAAFAGVIHQFDGLRDGAHKRLIEQGYEMGRPSQIDLSIEVERGALTGLRIGGYALRTTSGALKL